MSTEHRSPNSLFPPVSQPSQYTSPQRRDLPTEIPRIPDNDGPSTEWLPIYNERTLYVEAEIVHLIHEILSAGGRDSPVVILDTIENTIRVMSFHRTGGYSALSYTDFEDEWMRRKIKHYLEGTYGWPDNFNQEAWDEDRDRIWEETEEEYERLGRHHVLRFL
ncbi:hypothetical protein DID88_004435 [Monilinia fructigena]|uniref:Uncharacterized protein n=1 Tax=Monilinia fructigena TaxID=38457 RepID=A0A395IQL4_9HELO|nr:hypothetical protein DID88_004435 [Monilinia fructigena]